MSRLVLRAPKVSESDVYEMRLIFGAPGNGKTSLVDQYYREAKAHGRDVVIVDPQNAFIGYPERWWGGVAEVEDFVWSLKGRRRGLLILDDADLYLDSGAGKTSVFRDLFVSYRHWGFDVVITARRPQEVPKIATDNAKYLALFAIRGWRTQQWLANQLGPKIMRQVPREPHKYLLVDVDTDEATLYATEKRQHVVEADNKV